jgi:O-antigen ligase/tetratricopeptide (TPR) repeat protein
VIKKPSAPIVLLCLVAFFLPIFGGQISNDRQALTPGAFFPALLGGFEIPLLTHFLFAALIAGAVVLALARRQILQVPNPWVGYGTMVLCAAVLVSVALSAFRVVSVGVAAEWLTYGMAAFATTMCLGRKEGPRLFVRSLVAGCFVTAVFAIREYGIFRVQDPGYRVYGGWVNPNAYAGLLIVGIVLSLALAASGEQKEGLAMGIAMLAQSVALVLTGSRAGLLAGLVAILVFFALLLVWKVGKPLVVKGLAVFAVLVVAVGAVTLASRGSSGAPSGLGRATAGVSSGDQSAGFRKLLYQGAFQLIKQRPLGYGIGTYRYYSSKPGLTTQTVLTHDSYLQIQLETGFMGLFAFLAIVGGWFVTCSRSVKELPKEQNALRAGVVGAVVAILAQGVVESNLYYFGIGTLFFCLLGVGMMISGDGVAPEYMAKNLRVFGMIASVFIAFVLLYCGLGEMYRGFAFGARAQKDLEGARGNAQTALAMLPGDSEALGLLVYTQTGPEQLEDAKLAAQDGPSTTALRRLAQVQAQLGDTAGALETYSKVLELDPNNLLALTQMLDIQAKGDPAGAKITAERLVAVEGTPYYKVRSLPELIPTETLDARVYLASIETDPVTKAALLRAAMDGYVRYAQVTVPPVARSGDEGYGGVRLEEAAKRVAGGRALGEQLKVLYQTRNNAEGLAAVGKADEAFDAADKLIAAANAPPPAGSGS